MPDARRPYKAWGYPIVPAIFVVAAAFGVLSAYVAAPITSFAGTIMLVVGVFAHRWFSARKGAAATRNIRD